MDHGLLPVLTQPWFDAQPERFVEAREFFTPASGGDNKTETKSGVSLRMYDYFVVSFAGRHGLILYKTTAPCIVSSAYATQLKAFTKRQFDPFRRGDPGFYRDTRTTQGQLNFFAWACENGIVEYVIGHCAEIKKEMSDALADQRERRTRDRARVALLGGAVRKQPLHNKPRVVAATAATAVASAMDTSISVVAAMAPASASKRSTATATTPRTSALLLGASSVYRRRIIW